jgi:filamentous hemagglutinin family protein
MNCIRNSTTNGCTIIVTILVISFYLTDTSRAQVSTEIMPTGGAGSLGTTVTQTNNVYNITGGTRPGGGVNIFHSFGEFNVGINDIANFKNETALPTTNILGRVTGGNSSHIFGTIQTTGFGNANLFLMNPAGFLFGPNLALNVGGLVTFTSADYMKLADGTRFNTIPNAATDGLLSTAPVTAYGFLGSNPGAIVVQGSKLTVKEDTGISMVAGDITIQAGTLPNEIIQSAKLSAPGGQMHLTSVAEPGEVFASDFEPAVGMTRGSILLSQGSVLDVSGDTAGSVRIRSGQLVVDQSTISADTGNVDGASVAIDIDVTNSFSLLHDSLPVLTARTSGSGNAGSILLSSESLDAVFSTASSMVGTASLIDSHTTGSGHGGNITLKTQSLAMNGDSSAPGYFIDSGSGGQGNGGDVSIIAKTAKFVSGGINSGDNTFPGTGSGGNLTIKAESLIFESISFATDSFNAKAGAISFEASDQISIRGNSFVSNISLLGENPISFKADHLIVEQNNRILSGTALNTGGDTNIMARIVEFKDGSTLSTQTFGDGDAGNVHIVGSEVVRFLDSPSSGSPSGLFTTSFGDAGLGSLGKAGNITITTPRLEMMNGARINTTTLADGRGGDVSIAAPDGVSIFGERAFDVPEEMFNLGGTRASGIYTRTAGSDFCTGQCGNAGNVNITTGTLNLQNGGLIDSGTTNNGQGGNIAITASSHISLFGAMADGTSSGVFSRSIGTASDAGTGGNIALTAGQSMTIQDGASVSASSSGPGNAGNIFINAGRQLDVQNGSITTEATHASGGNIDIRAIDLIRVVNSPISSSVQGGPSTAGGNITIDPKTVILQNAQILANAQQGNGGNITITTPTFLADQFSRVDASSQFGLSGRVTIQSPTSNLSGTVKQLPSKPSDTQALLQNRCAALAGGDQSTFIVAGRDARPLEPGGWLSSPISMEHLTGEGLEHAAGLRSSTRAAEKEILSLRRLTPPGFLVRAFAVGPTGCRS